MGVGTGFGVEVEVGRVGVEVGSVIVLRREGARRRW